MKFGFRKRHAFIFVLIVLILRQILRKRRRTKCNLFNQRTKSTLRHRIVFGGTGGSLVYQFAVFKAIVKHLGPERFLKQCTFEGISGGAAVAFFVLACMYGNDTMDNVYKNALALPAYTASNRSFGMLWTTSDLIYETIYKHIKRWSKQNGDRIPDWLWSDPRIAVWVTCIGWHMQHELLSIDTEKIGKNDIESIAKWCSKLGEATTFWPLILSKWLYCCIDGKRYIDGGIALTLGHKTVFKTKNINNEPCKIMYINCDFSTKRQYDVKTFENGNIVYYLDIWKWTEFGLSSYMIWGDAKHCDNLYQKGYDSAWQHMTEIQSTFDQFFSFDGIKSKR